MDQIGNRARDFLDFSIMSQPNCDYTQARTRARTHTQKHIFLFIYRKLNLILTLKIKPNKAFVSQHVIYDLCFVKPVRIRFLCDTKEAHTAMCRSEF